MGTVNKAALGKALIGRSEPFRGLLEAVIDSASRYDIGALDNPGPGVFVLDRALDDLEEAVNGCCSDADD